MNFRQQASKQATCNLASGIPNEFPSARIIFALVRTILPPRGTKLDSTQQTWIQLSLKTFLFPTTGSRLDSHASQFVTPSGPALMVRPGLTLTLPAAIAATATGTASTTAASRSLTRVLPNNTHESATDQHSRECDRTTLTRVRLQPSWTQPAGLNPGKPRSQSGRCF